MNFEVILPQCITVLILIAILLTVFTADTISKLIGSETGFVGVVIAAIIGSITLIPSFVAFPLAGELMKKGASFFNILIFVGAWSTTKIPMLLFEMESLGSRFALSRLAIDIVGIILIALAIKATVPKKEVERIYQEAENQN